MYVDGNQVSRVTHSSFFPAQNILEVPRQDKNNKNFSLQVVNGNSCNKTGTNYGILSVVGGIRTNLQSKWNECFLQRIVETLPAILVVFYIDVSFAYYLTFSTTHSHCLLNMKIDKRPLRYYTQKFRINFTCYLSSILVHLELITVEWRWIHLSKRVFKNMNIRSVM